MFIRNCNSSFFAFESKFSKDGISRERVNSKLSIQKKKVLELENNRRAKILFSSLFFVVLNSTNEFPNMTKKWQTSFRSWVHELELARIEGIIRRISAWKKITFFFISTPSLDSANSETGDKKKVVNLRYPRMLEWNCEEWWKRRMDATKKKKKKLSNLIKGESVKRAARC